MTDQPITVDEYLAAARARLDRVKPKNLQAEIDKGTVVVDVRDSAQRERDGELPGAHQIDLTILEWRLAPSSEFRTIEIDPAERVILICNHGYSSSLAAARLQDLGLSNATDVDGGFTAWKAYAESEV